MRSTTNDVGTGSNGRDFFEDQIMFRTSSIDRDLKLANKLDTRLFPTLCVDTYIGIHISQFRVDTTTSVLDPSGRDKFLDSYLAALQTIKQIEIVFS